MAERPRMDRAKALALLGFEPSPMSELLELASVHAAFVRRVHAIETGDIREKKDELRLVSEALQYLSKRPKHNKSWRESGEQLARAKDVVASIEKAGAAHKAPMISESLVLTPRIPCIRPAVSTWSPPLIRSATSVEKGRSMQRSRSCLAVDTLNESENLDKIADFELKDFFE